MIPDRGHIFLTKDDKGDGMGPQGVRQTRWRRWKGTFGVFLSAAMVWAAGVALAFAAEPTLEEAYLVRLINELRVHPQAMLERLGIPVDAARAALGDDAWLLDYGAPPLARNPALDAAALTHLDDMVSRLYYSSISPEGLGPWDRAVAAGYSPLAVEEVLGLLGIVTFMEWPEAVWTVFSQWVQAQLAAQATGPPRLWHAALCDVGVAFRPVSVVLDETVFNFYVAVAVFAVPTRLEPQVVGAIKGPPTPNDLPGGVGFVSGYRVECRDADGIVVGGGPSDPLGGFQCPMVGGRVQVAVIDEGSGAVMFSQVAQSWESHWWTEAAVGW
mgnify:CR=1 FL=1|uniref:CAP domain-containing protein n=1 Tax=Desulfacinum infernum TaxID=35837 RepID=A0A832EKW9_9BACT